MHHLNCIRNLASLRKNKTKPGISGPHSPTFAYKTEICDELNLFIVGFISSSVQFLLLREVMNITGGYELIAGAFLSSWLIGSAAGSLLASGLNLINIRKINLLFSTSPLISIALLLILSRIFLNPGETPSFLSGVILTFLVLLPTSLISGFIFIKLIYVAKTKKNRPGKSFSIETTGGILSGIVISILSSGALNTYQSLLLVITMGISYTTLNFYIEKKSLKLVFKFSALIISILIIISSPDRIFRHFLLRGIKVIETFDTPYGNITRGEYYNDTSIYYNHRLMIYSNDILESEEDIHYGMLQTENTDNVLLISGPLESRLKEINKYNVSNVVYVEQDPALSDLTCYSEAQLSTRLNIKNTDAFRYVRETHEKFDAVIMLLPPPSSLSINRYYTYEFFVALKNRMNTDGIFSCSPGINPYYFNEQSVRLFSSIFNSLKSVFINVIPVFGNKLYFVSSDNDLSTSICKLVNEKELNNIYVGPNYLSDDLIAIKTEEVISLIDTNIKINQFVVPIASFYFQSFNLSKNLNEKIPSIILLAILFAFTLRSFQPRNALMYFSSFALAGYEIMLLLLLQITVGNMYQLTGLIIAGLLAGLAIGSGMTFPLSKRKPVGCKVILLVFFYVTAGLFAERFISINNQFCQTGLLVISGLLPAVITGSFFRELTSERINPSDPSAVYSADLSGSALGFIVFSGLAIPLAGIKNSFFILPVLVFTGFLLTSLNRES
jgi:predicted membrane-bound spermidine synthase